MRPFLLNLYQTRAASYRDSLKQFVSGYKEGFREGFQTEEGQPGQAAAKPRPEVQRQAPGGEPEAWRQTPGEPGPRQEAAAQPEPWHEAAGEPRPGQEAAAQPELWQEAAGEPGPRQEAGPAHDATAQFPAGGLAGEARRAAQSSPERARPPEGPGRLP
jgi:hypothetical protein